jgi:hypothetical protein
MEYCISGVGVDPGSVDMGAGGAVFSGLFDVENEDGSIKTVPRISVTSMERWNLKSGIVYRPSPCMTKIVKTVLNPPSIKSENVGDWLEPLGQAIGEANWMFEPYQPVGGGVEKLPFLIVENQFDHIKSDFMQTQLRDITRFCKVSIFAADARERALAEKRGDVPLGRRVCYGGMSKYGQRCDASRIRVDRKGKTVDDMKELLEDQNDPVADLWLNWLCEMEAIGEQIHDMCDAVLLVVQKQISLYELKIKSDIQQSRTLIKRIPRAPIQRKKPTEPAFNDDYLTEVDCGGGTTTPTKKPKKAKKPSGEKKERKVRSDKGKSKTTPKPKKDKEGEKEVKKRKDRDENEKPDKKPTKKKKSDKYPILLDIRDM